MLKDDNGSITENRIDDMISILMMMMMMMMMTLTLAQHRMDVMSAPAVSSSYAHTHYAVYAQYAQYAQYAHALLTPTST